MQISRTPAQSNFFTRLPPDLFRMIGLLAGGRVFARLGGCCCQLNQLVKKATLVWKQFYIENNWGINPVSELDWREKYCLQELIKRNIRCNNFIKNDISSIVTSLTKDKISFSKGLFYFRLTDRTVTCDRKGKLVETYYEPWVPVPQVESKNKPTDVKHTFRILDNKIQLLDPDHNEYVDFASVVRPTELIIRGNQLIAKWFVELIVWDIEKKKKVLEFPGDIARRDYEETSNKLLLAYSLPLSLQLQEKSVNHSKINLEKTVLFNEEGLVIATYPTCIYDFTQPLPPKRWWNKLGF